MHHVPVWRFRAIQGKEAVCGPPAIRTNMRQLYCPHCRTKILFEDRHCLHCNTSIAFDLHDQTMQETAAIRPCANRTLIGCNWTAGPGEAFCQSCRLTRIIPNLGSDRNVALWKRV